MGDAETGLAPTVLGQKVIETDAHLAWALDPDFGEAATAVTSPKVSAKSAVAAAVAGALLLIAGAGGVAVWHLRDEPAAVAPAEPPAAPEPSPPDRVITGLPEPTGRAAYDARFLEKLAAAGWYIRSPSWMTQRAHQMCEEFDLGTSPERVYQKFIGQGMSTHEAIEFMNLVTQTYPGCG